MSALRFEVLANDSGTAARTGRLFLPHGEVPTPVFMPVGTRASVRALTQHHLLEIGVPIILGNTYHLALRPGADVIERRGGLHGFMNWQRPILTDSGGFQVFSLAKNAEISEDGVVFKSHLDGAKINFTPEAVVRIQEQLGSDILMPIDQPVAWGADRDQTRVATDRTHRWAVESLAAQQREDQALFAIVQGGFEADLRQESAAFLREHAFPGFAIGGLSVGEPTEKMFEMLALTTPELPKDRPRYLMGVGKPSDIVEAVARGVDMFDCILPTRMGRHGAAWTDQGTVNLKNARFIEEDGPIDESCECTVCRTWSCAYLCHLIRSDEILGLTLVTYHNVWYYIRLMERIRSAIRAGTFAELYALLRA